MAALRIVLRDLKRLIRNPVRTALLFALPLMLAGIFTLVFGGDGGDGISIRVLVYDEDDGIVSRLLQGVGSAPEMDQKLELVPVGVEGFEMMERGEASALVHLPAGFSKTFLDGEPTTIQLLKNPAERFLPQVVEEGVGIGAEILSEGSRIFRPELETIGKLLDSKVFPADLAVAGIASGVNAKLRGLDKWLFPPVIDLETITITSPDTDAANGGGILAFFLPGLAMMGVLFLAQNATRDILQDRESGLLRHLLTAPVSPGDYLMGKCLSVLVVTVLGFVFLIGIGSLAGVDWGSPLNTAALILAASLGATGTLLLIMSLVGTERQGDALSTIVIMVWCLVGGAFFPLSQMPSFLESVSKSTLVYWAVDGFQKTLQTGAGLAEILPNLLILTGFGMGFLLIGAFVLRRRMAQGVL
ncbi:MAG: ABC transporter permease [Thermoanaerobaculales bacterium]|nr:ABC transporter permease [Thermoanaerobaculales bacterium]